MNTKPQNSDRVIAVRPALFVVDAQNCFMAPGGSYDKMKFNIQEYRKIIGSLKEVFVRARKLNIPVFFSKAIREASGIDNLDRIHRILPAQRRERIKRVPLCIRGTWDSDIIAELGVDPAKEHIVEKRRDSAFQGTELQVWLAALGVDTLVFAGIDTSVCVESTIRDAFNHGYDVILLSDATASLNKEFYKSTIGEVRENFGLVMSSEEFYAKLKKENGSFSLRLGQG